MAQLYNELAERELLKKFRHEHSWMGELQEKNQWVSNDVIKVPRQGAGPNVLINNNIYPILSNNRADDFISLSLNKYDTENTTVTDDELYALPYEKTSDVQVQHREALEDMTAVHGLYSISVPAHTNDTPIFATTGPINPVTGKRRLISADLINEWAYLTKIGVPLKGRVKVLSAEHAADLMFEDSNRQNTWGAQWLDGTVPVSHVGFRLWVDGFTPLYTQVGGVWTKTAFQATDGNASSITFHKNNVAKATGTVKRYARLADQDPENRKSTIGFRLWAIAVGLQDQGTAATVSTEA